MSRFPKKKLKKVSRMCLVCGANNCGHRQYVPIIPKKAKKDGRKWGSFY